VNDVSFLFGNRGTNRCRRGFGRRTDGICGEGVSQ
jgi:hypothetical protein